MTMTFTKHMIAAISVATLLGPGAAWATTSPETALGQQLGLYTNVAIRLCGQVVQARQQFVAQHSPAQALGSSTAMRFAGGYQRPAPASASASALPQSRHDQMLWCLYGQNTYQVYQGKLTLPKQSNNTTVSGSNPYAI
jgi:hypothetical protein